MSRRVLAVLLPLFALFTFGAPAPSMADADGVVRFATLPAGPGHPEGIAADSAGRIFVATFDFVQPNVIYIFGRNGKVDETIHLRPGVLPLGMEFDRDGNLYVADFANGDVLQFTPPFNAGSTLTVGWLGAALWAGASLAALGTSVYAWRSWTLVFAGTWRGPHQPPAEDAPKWRRAETQSLPCRRWSRGRTAPGSRSE